MAFPAPPEARTVSNARMILLLTSPDLRGITISVILEFDTEIRFDTGRDRDTLSVIFGFDTEITEIVIPLKSGEVNNKIIRALDTVLASGGAGNAINGQPQRTFLGRFQ
jgi:hypothetical protein